MHVTDRDKQLYGSQVCVIKKDKDCAIYKIHNSTGSVVMTSYSVFPGIELIYNDVHAQFVSVDVEPPKYFGNQSLQGRDN